MHFESEAALQAVLQSITKDTLIGYQFQQWGRPAEREHWAVFTVRTDEWTVAEVIEEMRNLQKSDQGEAGRIVLVVPSLAASDRKVINGQGFFVLDRTDLQKLSD